MIIQCAQCSSKFRLDDSKVTDAGIKVRCSKCRHIFVIKKEAAPAEETDFDSILQGLHSTGARGDAVAGESLSGNEGESVEVSSREDSGGAAFAAEGESVPSQPELATPVEDEDFSFDFGGEPTTSLKEPPTQAAASAPDSLVFDEAVAESETMDGFRSDDSGAEPAPVSDSVEGLGGDITFGEVSPEAFAAATGSGEREEGAATDFTLEFEEEPDKRDVSLDIESEEAEPFDFGEIDLGIDDAQHEPASPDRIPIAAVTPPEPHAGDSAVTTKQEDQAAVPFGEEEPPPLVISSRRKGRSLLPLFVIVVSVVVIVALAGFGFYFFKEGPAAFDKLGVGFMAEWLGLEGREEGGISLDKVRGLYLTNAEAGEVFVIRGEAVNNYRKPRASIQVKGALVGPGGQALVHKVAYCGNNLSDEQISSLPMAKIESAMNNQFGDSLSNLGVQPGKRIPFVIVLMKIPGEATDFTVEVTGSTVATQ